MHNAIIAAIATAQGEGGIAIVRLSGSGSTALADLFFNGKSTLGCTPPRILCYGYLKNRTGTFIDEVLAVRFEKGQSYTGEESVEIHCHGGTVPARTCLELMLKNGARLADPGEFTKRAFLSGRIDLIQAESVMSIVRAKNDAAFAAAGRVLAGELGQNILQLLDTVNSLAAEIEVGLDFPEEASEESSSIPKRIRSLQDTINRILSRCYAGNLTESGFSVVLLGRPNVGKSSLLNAILGEDKAIVTPIPGTTRDRVEGSVSYRGLDLHFIDTAGIRTTLDPVEIMGVERSLDALQTAHICVWVIDASDVLTEEDLNVADLIKNREHVVVMNKNDLTAHVEKEYILSILPDSKILEISATLNVGLETLKEYISERITGRYSFEECYAAPKRLITELEAASSHLNEALQLSNNSAPQDVIASALLFVRENLSSILGIDAGEDLLNRIFNDFCVGK